MKEFRLSSNFYAFATGVATLGALVYLFNAQPAIAPVFMAAAIPFVVGIIGGMQQSKQNTEKIDKLDIKVDANTEVTETTHKAVNSQMDDFKQALLDVAAMKEAQAIMLAELTAAKAELAIANERERGIAIGRDQVLAEVAPAGSTPAHGTPVVKP
jgi:hypothetical protein